MTPLYRTSRPHESVLPRAQSGYTREHTHGPLIGMDEAQGAIRELVGKVWRFMLGAVLVSCGALVGHSFELINIGAGW